MIQGSLEYVYTVNFDIELGIPSCSCSDWMKWQLPCKHFFALFRLVPEWSWESLPESYKKVHIYPLSTQHCPSTRLPIKRILRESQQLWNWIGHKMRIYN